MENVNSTSGLGEWVSYGKFTFKNITDQVRTTADPDDIQKFKDHCVIFNPSKEESVEKWRSYFSDTAMSKSPVIADIKKETDEQASSAINQFFNGEMTGEELSEVFQGLSQKLTDACKERGYPISLWGGEVGSAALQSFYSEFRRMVLEEAVQRNNVEGRQYLTGEMTAQRNWKYYNSDYYYQSEEAINALTDKFGTMAKEKGWEEYIPVPDYKAKGLNLYDNFNSALSNHFDVSEQYILDSDLIPPKDFRWFYQSGGNDGSGVVSSLTMIAPDGTETFIDYAGRGFDPMNPTKGTTWAAYKDEDGIWQHTSADFTYDFSKSDLKNVASLLNFSGKAGRMQETANQFLKNLQVYSRGYFSRFAQHGQISMSTHA